MNRKCDKNHTISIIYCLSTFAITTIIYFNYCEHTFSPGIREVRFTLPAVKLTLYEFWNVNVFKFAKVFFMTIKVFFKNYLSLRLTTVGMYDCTASVVKLIIVVLHTHHSSKYPPIFTVAVIWENYVVNSIHSIPCNLSTYWKKNKQDIIRPNKINNF